MLSRIKVLQEEIKNQEAILLTSPSDIKYYTDFNWLLPLEREALLLITKNHAYLFHASFSPVTQTADITLFAGCYPNQVVNHFHTILKTDSFSVLKLDAEFLFLHEFQAISKIPNLKTENFDKNIVWSQRLIKDQAELSCIRKAIKISNTAFETVQSQIQVGMTEKEIKELLETTCKNLGGEGMAFPTIIAFGPHAALPHHQPDDTILKLETCILIDFGARFNGYCSDMTRTIWFGSHPSALFKKIENSVQKAYALALDLLNNNNEVTAKMLDAKARSSIESDGYGSNFIHTTGHGVGLDIHEPPSLNWNNPQPLEKNMVITIEPGIYLEGELGYRYENTVIL